MTTVTARMSYHSTAPASSTPFARVVISQLGRGSSAIGASALSLKLLLEGEELYKIDGRTFRLVPGQLLVVEPGVSLEATVRGNQKTKGLCIYFPPDTECAADPEMNLTGRVTLRAAAATVAGRQLVAAGTEAHRAFESSAVLGRTVLLQARAFMDGSREEASEHLRRLKLKRPRAQTEVLNRLEMARAHLHEVTDRAVPLSELAALVGLSAFQLARYFSAAYRLPPVAYHRSIRMRLAVTLLKGGHHSATDVSAIIGYSDLSAFSHAFRREFGRSPTSVQS